MSSAILAPAVAALSQHPRELLTVVGLPSSTSSLQAYGEHAINIVGGLVWRFDAPAFVWVSSTPILDVASFAMLVLGVYSLRFERGLLRSKIQLGLTGLALVLALTMGPVGLLAVTPLLYLLITGGFAFMLQQWFAVFPKNPFARAVAVISITAAVTGIAGYHTYRYWVAWPGHPETKAVISQEYLVK
jgi:hypothetical protein